MKGVCFRFPAASIARHVVEDLRVVHPGAGAIVLGDRVHVPETTWRAPLVPELMIGYLGRLVTCEHAPARPDGSREAASR